MDIIQWYFFLVACANFLNFIAPIVPINLDNMNLSGKYINTIDTPNFYNEDSIQIFDDQTYRFARHRISGDKNENIEGDIKNIISAERINTKVTEIFIENDNILNEDHIYKYKDSLGSYIPVKFPHKTSFNLSVPEELGTTSGYIFYDDGHVHNCININNCHCANNPTYNYYYVCNGTEIFLYNSNTEEYDTILYHLVGNGAFQEIYTKKVEE